MSRIEREKAVLRLMIGVYCRGRHGHRGLCPECEELYAYACRRLDLCRYGEAKRTCRRCPTHCYSPSRRRQIRAVMRYSGWRMIFLRPWEAVRHFSS